MLLNWNLFLALHEVNQDKKNYTDLKKKVLVKEYSELAA